MSKKRQWDASVVMLGHRRDHEVHLKYLKSGMGCFAQVKLGNWTDVGYYSVTLLSQNFYWKKPDNRVFWDWMLSVSLTDLQSHSVRSSDGVEASDRKPQCELCLQFLTDLRYNGNPWYLDADTSSSLVQEVKGRIGKIEFSQNCIPNSSSDFKWGDIEVVNALKKLERGKDLADSYIWLFLHSTFSVL